MTDEAEYIAQSMSFEARCAAAKEGLGSLYKLIQDMAETDLQYREKKVERDRAFLEASNDREGTLDFLSMLTGLVEGHQEKYLKIIWDNGFAFERRMFGSDAVDFALEMIKRETRKN